MKRKSWRIAVFALLLTMAFAFRAQSVEAAGGTVYVSVEKFSLGQGYLVEPTAVTFTEGENYAQIFDRVIRAAGYDYENTGTLTDNFYLSGIIGADTKVIDIPDCIQNMEPAGKMEPPTNESAREYAAAKDNNDLFEFDYSDMSGWYYFVNNEASQVGMAGGQAKDGDVVRYQFTLCYGADLGDSNSFAFTPLKLPNRDDVTRNLALLKTYANKNVQAQAVYNDAVRIVSDLDSTAEQISAANAAVSRQLSICQQQDAQNNGAVGSNSNGQDSNAVQNGQQATVSVQKTKLKSAKKQSARSVRLTWKKVKGCTGYEVYMSKKKNSGYKKIATLKKAKKVTYTKKKLKKKKTYYFKVRTYKTVNGKKYYSTFSNVKKVKMK